MSLIAITSEFCFICVADQKGEPLGGRAAAAVVAMEASGPLSGGARSDSLSAETLVAMHSEFPSMRTLVDAASLEGGVRCGSLGAATSPAHTESTLNDPSGMSASRAIAAEAAAPAMLPSCLTRLISREKFRELDEKLGSSAYVLTGRARAALELGDLKGAFLLIQRLALSRTCLMIIADIANTGQNVLIF